LWADGWIEGEKEWKILVLGTDKYSPKKLYLIE
jgi:hypothetical protein